MSVTKEQAMAYTEVIQVLKYMPKEEVNKIPKDILEFYNNNMDTSYEFSIDTNKSFEEQILLEKTKIVLAILFRDYWATDEQREKIKQKENYDTELLEEEKRKRYNSDNIFAHKNVVEQEKEVKALVEYKKETWFNKFIQFMKNFFGGNKKK